MKTKLIYTIILALSILTLQLNAQTPDSEKIEVIAENCYNALKHENNGVSESAIFLSIQFKNRFPNQNSSKFIEMLDEMASESSNPRVSYKAQIAKIYFNNYDWFNGIAVGSIDTEQEVFEEISEKINSIMFATDL